ncbi:MAG: TlpA disulfide reductase family protein [Planctomycetota bacterium]|nr:TlpA disulfide reductase family protein [Planctomycetota bacterium]MDA1113717.1 TlpA disulfide reductase family protein [Planctomycetota bacterium]
MAEVPHLVKMQKEFGGEDFSVVGLMQGNAQAASQFSLAQKLNYPIFANSKDFDAYDVMFLPVTYLVDPSGMIVADDLDDAEKILAQRSVR